MIYPGLAAGPGEPAADEDREPYFLTLATFEPRKNHLGLLRALRLARERGLSLRWKVAGIEGYGSREILSRLRREEGVDVLGRVSNANRERLYRGARFFAFPSHAEGFGFPPLEAMARGVPTICATGTAMDETVGAAALDWRPTTSRAGPTHSARLRRTGASASGCAPPALLARPTSAGNGRRRSTCGAIEARSGPTPAIGPPSRQPWNSEVFVRPWSVIARSRGV